MRFVSDYLSDLKKTIDGLNPEAVGTAIEWLRDARYQGKSIYLCGNGGSASICSQMVVDMLKGASYGYKTRFKILSFTDTVATITAYANDVDYDCVFVEQLKNFASEGDVLIAVSGSGNSRNVLQAVEYANQAGCRTIGLTQSSGGKLKDMASLTLGVPNTHMGRLEDCFFVMTHIMVYAFMDGAVS
jgi:D-sedoheptulose 7-phosphate isomerase